LDYGTHLLVLFWNATLLDSETYVAVGAYSKHLSPRVLVLKAIQKLSSQPIPKSSFPQHNPP
jgi:hypothetical protein